MMHAKSRPIQQLDSVSAFVTTVGPIASTKNNGPSKLHLALVITEPDPLLTTIRPVSRVIRAHEMKTATQVWLNQQDG
jgi:hypothetical protein